MYYDTSLTFIYVGVNKEIYEEIISLLIKYVQYICSVLM